MLGGGGPHNWVSSQCGWSPPGFSLVPMGGDGTGLAAMTFSIPPRPPPPPHVLHAEGEVLQRVVLYAPSSVLRFLLFFLLIAIRLLLVLAVRFRVVLPGVPLMSLLAKGRLAFLGVLRVRRSDPVRGRKALHMQRPLALPTGVLFACLICSTLFLKFCLGKMAECMKFQDYLQAGVHDSVLEGTPAASWAKAKMRLTKSLCHLGDLRVQWLQTFANASGFGGTEDALIENLIGYTPTEHVQINITTGAFANIRVQSSNVSKTSDLALMSLLEGRAAPLKSLTEKVNSLSEAPTRSEKSVPPLCLKELHDLAPVWDHPQWVTRVLYYLKCAILKEALPLHAMRMTPKWDDEAHKPLLFNLSDDQKKDTTVWTEVVGTGDSAGDAPMDGSSGTPPPPAVLSLNSSAVLMVESLWLLVWSSVHCYKERYESDSTSSKQA